MLVRVLSVAVLSLGLLLSACSSAGRTVPASAPAAPTMAPTTAAVSAAPTAARAPAAAPTTAPAAPAPATDGMMRFVLPANGSEARYRVKEQLAQRNLPGDAIGATNAVTGQIVVSPSGAIDGQQSKIVVDLRSLRSDESRRDNFISRNTLETQRFPTAEFVPREIRGLPSPLPTSGEATFQLLGDLTIRGVTRPTTWDVTARFDGRELVGQARTSFRFGDFGMSQPRVPLVLSVEDNIRLEIDLRLQREA